VEKVILIVASNAELVAIWAKCLEGQNHEVVVATSQADAVDFLCENEPDVMVLDVMLSDGSVIATADFASYRRPEMRIVFVTRSSFFADGSLFRHIPNTAAIIPEKTSPSDLAEIVAYHGRAS
jgi:CheY-like chemotaxis protein